MDNVKARQYIDARSVWFEKPLFDSGTEGTKCSTTCILPHLTTCYRDVGVAEAAGIPVCTLKIFPHEVEHCIEWGRDSFEGNFTNTPQEILKLLPDLEGYLSELPGKGNSRQQKIILTGIFAALNGVREGAAFESCVLLARAQF